MPNYSNGKVYTIRFHNSNEIYIGSTIQPLAVRFGSHKRDLKSAVYKLINDKYDGDFSNCYIELYENYECKSKEELTKKEGEVIRLFKNDSNYECINCKIAGRTKKEYRENNCDVIAEKKKEYYEVNKEVLLEKKKEYYENNKQVLAEKHKEYYENNKQVLAEKKKEYYENNRDKLKEKTTCACGGKYTYINKAQHFKTKLHQDYIASLA